MALKTLKRRVPQIYPIDYVNGLGLLFDTTEKVKIGKGNCRDSTNTFNIDVNSELTADIVVSGKNGLDTGSESANTWYRVHVIADSNKVNSVACLLSLSSTSPTLPSGYNIFRHIGWVKNNSSSNIWKFYQVGVGRQREYQFDESRTELAALTSGSATVFTALSLASFMPPGTNLVRLRTNFQNEANDDKYYFRTTGSILTKNNTPMSFRPGILTDVPLREPISLIITDDNQSIDYVVDSVNNNLWVYVIGFVDFI